MINYLLLILIEDVVPTLNNTALDRSFGLCFANKSFKGLALMISRRCLKYFLASLLVTCNAFDAD